MPNMVGVRFGALEKIGYYDPNGIELALGDRVEVEDDHGTRRGRVAISPDQVLHSDLRGPMQKVLARLDEDRS